MKNIYFILLGVLLCGCWREQTPLSFERIVKLSTAESLDSYQKYFSAVVSSKNSVDLAFAVPGMVQHMYASEGERVSKNQLLARLNDDDYKHQVNSDLSRYQTALSILERTERLASKRAVSAQELEIANSDFEQAKSNYNYAKNRLEDTYLRAPFAGSIEKSYADTYMEVNAGTLIYRLINPDNLEVKFTLPESDVNMLLVPLEYYVVFDNLPNKKFPAKLNNYIDGSSASAGLPFTLNIDSPTFNASEMNIKAGFSCRVIVRLTDNQSFKNYTTVPLSALLSQNELWIYDPSDSRVYKRKIKSEGITSSNRVIISQGVTAGEMVVSAGIHSLTEGEKVKVLQ